MTDSGETAERIFIDEETQSHFRAVIQSDTLNETDLINSVKCPTAGAVSIFLGTTRDTFEGKVVTHLSYEAYTEMALESLLEIMKNMRTLWPIRHAVIAHKTGDCPVGETSVVIAISSAHRPAALSATSYAIDELKRIAPIWKKECYDDESSTWKANKEGLSS